VEYVFFRKEIQFHFRVLEFNVAQKGVFEGFKSKIKPFKLCGKVARFVFLFNFVLVGLLLVDCDLIKSMVALFIEVRV
jgi:hypothetical protein